MEPFSIRLFLPSGSPNGVIVASRDDWPGKAVIFPRELVGEVRGRKEYRQPGIYLLVSPGKAYIGEGDPVGDRLDSHVKKKDFWRKGVFFTAEAGRLNKAHVQHLESRLISLAKQAGRVGLENLNQPTVPALSEEDYAFAESFLRQILLMLPLLGFSLFSPPEVEADLSADAFTEQDVQEIYPSATSKKQTGSKRAAMYDSLPVGLEFTLTSRGANATLIVSGGGVIVKAGSKVANPISARFELDMPTYAAQRRQLLASEIIAWTETGDFVFSKDQFFSSGSAAASVTRGETSNADWWKGSQGKSLGDYIREANAAST